MRCTVTGGAGFIGSHVTDLLVQEGHDVTIVDNLSTGQTANLNPKARFLKVDIRDLENLTEALMGTEVVFHLAAWPRIQPSFEDPVIHEEVNVIGSIRVFEAAKRAGVRKIVYSSSSSCYGTPTELPTTENAAISCLSPYALQKYAGEQYLLMLGERAKLPVVSLRYFNVYGPRSFNRKDPFNAYSSVIGIFKGQRESGTALTVTGDGAQRRDFVHVRDVARANLAAALSKVSGEFFNIGFGQSYSILEIAQRFGGEIAFIPERLGEAQVTHANIDRAVQRLGWRPEVSLEKGLTLL